MYIFFAGSTGVKLKSLSELKDVKIKGQDTKLIDLEDKRAISENFFGNYMFVFVQKKKKLNNLYLLTHHTFGNLLTRKEEISKQRQKKSTKRHRFHYLPGKPPENSFAGKNLPASNFHKRTDLRTETSPRIHRFCCDHSRLAKDQGDRRKRRR